MKRYSSGLIDCDPARSRSFTKIGGSGDRCRYVNQFDGSIGFGIRVLSQWGTPRAVYEDGRRRTRIGRYYETGIIVGVLVCTRRTGLRSSIYSGRMALRRCTTIIIRSYWIITPHLVILKEKTYVDLPQVFPKRCISDADEPLGCVSRLICVHSIGDWVIRHLNRGWMKFFRREKKSIFNFMTDKIAVLLVFHIIL